MNTTIVKATPKAKWMPLWLREVRDCWKGMETAERIPLYGMMASAIVAWSAFIWNW